MKNISKIFGILLAAITLSLTVTSCGTIGYGLVLWNINEAGISDGDIVPVYIKSNVSHVYVISKDKKTKEKIEVPLWQISEPAKMGKIKKLKAKYSQYENTYARSSSDGLPVRADKTNLAKTIYRLRKDEVLRVLYETNDGEVVKTGNEALEGKWLRVLTYDGSEGWCFSHNLRLFKMNAQGQIGESQDVDAPEDVDALLETILATKWYPENFASMINSSTINLDLLRPDYGFKTGKDDGIISIKVKDKGKDFNVSYKFKGISKVENNVYKYDDVPVQFTIRNAKAITVKYTASNGMPKAFSFISTDADVEDVISRERSRRSQIYSKIMSAGPSFSSKNYGTITFSDGYSFKWTNTQLLVPSVISEGATGEGSVSFNYFLSKSLRNGNWDGIMAFKFNGQAKPVKFFYKVEATGLRLEDASKAPVDDEGYIVTSHATNPLVMFFAK